MSKLTADEIEDFNLYLRQCTDAQVLGVLEHEQDRGIGGKPYAALAKHEAHNRGLV